MNSVFYQNSETGEKTNSKEIAKKWYEQGADISVWWWSEVCGEFLNSIDWIH